MIWLKSDSDKNKSMKGSINKYAYELIWGLLYGLLALSISGAFALVMFNIGIELFILFFPFFIAIQIGYFLLSSSFALWFGYSPSYALLRQKIFGKSQEPDEDKIAQRAIRHFCAGFLMMILFDPAVRLVFHLI